MLQFMIVLAILFLIIFLDILGQPTRQLKSYNSKKNKGQLLPGSMENVVNENLIKEDVSDLVCKCPICSEEMKGVELIHYKCKKCNEYFTN